MGDQDGRGALVADGGHQQVHDVLAGERVAQRLLEETDESVDEVAWRSGFGNATAFRHHFRSWRGTTPAAYRRTFRSAVTPPG